MKLHYFSSRWVAGKPIVIFPTILTVDNIAHDFVVWVFLLGTWQMI